MSEKYVPVELRRLVVERARNCCEYCRAQARYSSDPFTIDHIIPFILGGLTIAANLAFCCYGCNQCKGIRIFAIDPVTGLSAPLFHPRQQRWEEHFAWKERNRGLAGYDRTSNLQTYLVYDLPFGKGQR